MLGTAHLTRDTPNVVALRWGDLGIAASCMVLWYGKRSLAVAESNRMESAKAFLLLVLVSCFAARGAAIASKRGGRGCYGLQDGTDKPYKIYSLAGIDNLAPRTVFLTENSPPGKTDPCVCTQFSSISSSNCTF